MIKKLFCKMSILKNKKLIKNKFLIHEIIPYLTMRLKKDGE